MSGLDQFSAARRLRLAEGAASTALDGCPTLLVPYLDWTLAMLDAASVDILLQSPDGREVIIVEGTAATLWLRFHKQDTAQV